jgi:uncharacterized protein (TIGR03083 family)
MTTHAPLPLPPGLRERMLATARAVRPPGRALPAPPEITPVEAFHRCADAFYGLLCALDDQQWHVRVLRDLDVHGLVGHLAGVEGHFQAALAGDPAVADADHVEATVSAAQGQAGRTPDETRRTWRAAADATSAILAEADDLDRIVAVHRIRLPLGSLLVVRAFELWTHENDIRAAVGLPPSVPDPSTLTLMTELASRLLPHGVARVEDGQVPVDLHLVLTGPGGGTWDLELGKRDAAEAQQIPEVTIVADTLGFCRLVANRIRPADLDAHLSGAVAHAPHILAGAAALALD